MKLQREALRLYAITDRTWLGQRELAKDVEAAILGGATMIQYREKTLSGDAFMEEACKVRDICRRYGVPFILNDRVELALALDADGVHVGQKDMEVSKARALLGPDKILGVSARTVEQAVTAEQNGADYLGVGAVFHTGTKENAKDLPREMLGKISHAVSIPVVAIGGITSSNILELKGNEIAGVAVVSAVFACSDIEKGTRELRAKADELI